MDRQLLERLIGASLLVVALVVVVPAILDGDRDGEDIENAEPSAAEVADEPRRTHTIRLDQSTQNPPVAREVESPAPVEPESSTGKQSAPNRQADSIQERQAASSAPSAPDPKPKPKPKPKPETQARPDTPKASNPVPVKPAPLPESGWVVQLGSFSSRQNAQRLADDVSGRGFPVFLTPLDRSGKKLYRVRVGPRNTRAQAAELATRLAKAGYAGQVTRQQPDA